MSSPKWSRLRSAVLVALLLLAISGCRTWQTEPSAELRLRERLPDPMKLVTEDRIRVLEGSRLEGDTLIGFWQADDGRWQRITLPLDGPDVHMRTYRVHWPLSALYVGGMVGLALMPVGIW